VARRQRAIWRLAENNLASAMKMALGIGVCSGKKLKGGETVSVVISHGVAIKPRSEISGRSEKLYPA